LTDPRPVVCVFSTLQGGFARVYLATEPDGITYKALKVVDKQQLKSTKTKSKVRLFFLISPSSSKRS
jgi:hypothetical protein